MLVAIHYPVCDLRSFFRNRLDRVSTLPWQFAQNGSLVIPELGNNESAFLRSCGPVSVRKKGGGEFLKELYYCNVGNELKIEKGKNQVEKIKIGNCFKRVYFFSDVSGRVEIGLPSVSDWRVALQAVEGYLSALRLSFPRQGATTYGVSQVSGFIGRFIQDRTTLEHALRRNDLPTSVFSGKPVIFIEASKSEIFGLDRIQPILLDASGLSIYHSWISPNIDLWAFVYQDNDRNVLDRVRLLRMYISRMYSESSIFHKSVRFLPGLADKVENSIPGNLLLDAFSAYLVSTQRRLSSLAKSARAICGLELGAIAQISDEASPFDQLDRVLDEIQPYIKRGNVFKDVKKRVSQDGLARAIKSGIEVDSLGAAGQVVGKRLAVVGIAREWIARSRVKPILDEISRLISLFVARRESTILNAADAIIEDMIFVTNKENVSGPILLSHLTRLEKLLSNTPFGKARLQEKIEEAKRLILIGYEEGTSMDIRDITTIENYIVVAAGQELAAVRSYLSGVATKKGQYVLKKRPVDVYEFETSTGKRQLLALMLAAAKGKAKMKELVEVIAENSNAKRVLMVGMMASLKGKVQLLDVIAPKTVFDASAIGTKAGRLVSEPEAGVMDPELHLWLSGADYIGTQAENFRVITHKKTITVAAKIDEVDHDLAKAALAVDPENVVGLEMEASALTEAQELNNLNDRKIGFLMIKGVADYAGEKPNADEVVELKKIEELSPYLSDPDPTNSPQLKAALQNLATVRSLIVALHLLARF